MAMEMLDVCPTEDAVLALFEYLVDPILPAKSLRENPSESQQNAVAKQVHAIVLLYNYYHRKQYPALEFLSFDSFCKLAVILKPSILGHLKFVQMSNNKELDDLENELSITEKTIMQACDISTVLDASREVPNVEGWPITKVSVFLLGSKKVNCLLLFSSITQGVWSVIEKDVEVCPQSIESTMETKQTYKRKRVIQKPSRVESKIDLTAFQQLAYLAVKEATGITQTDLMILEEHFVYSVSKEKTAVRFYIMQCTEPVNEDAIQLPVKDVIDSLQGPLVIKSSGRWIVTPAVEYFHVLPYAGILSEWMQREIHLNSLQDSERGQNPESMKSPGASTLHKIQDSSNVNIGREVCSNKTTAADLKSPKEKDFNGFSNANWLQTSPIQEKCNDISYKNQADNHQTIITSACTSDLNGSASGVNIQLGVMGSTAGSDSTNCKIEKVACGNKIGDSISGDQYRIGSHLLLSDQSNSGHLEKIQSIIASKENILTQTAYGVLMRRRDKLSLQLRNLEDEIAECDKKIHTILNGGEDDFTLKIESIIECCNDVCLRSATQERTNQLLEDQLSPQYHKRKRLPEAILSMQNPCQELDAVCYANNWILPTYHVDPAEEGGFRANVGIKGADFESDCSSEDNKHSSPREARESAAAQMLVKLRELAAQAQ